MVQTVHEIQARYRKAHPEREKERKARYNADNAERISKESALWRAAHPGYGTTWGRNNPEKRRESVRRRRAKRADNGWEVYTEAQVLEAYGTDCHICGEPIDMDAPRSPHKGEGWRRGLQFDHVVPVSKGGSDTLANVKPAHGLCNKIKGTKLPKKKGREEQ